MRRVFLAGQVTSILGGGLALLALPLLVLQMTRDPMLAPLAAAARSGTVVFGGDPRPVFLICGSVLVGTGVAAWFLSLRHQGAYGQARNNHAATSAV